MEADPTEDILGPKKRNYDFLQFVREKKYAQALLLGKQILKDSPDNPSVRKFVEFIEKNAKKLDDMVKEEEEYQSVHSSDDSDSEEQAEGEGEEKENEDEKSSSEKDSKEDEQQQEQEQEKPEKKVVLSTCTLNSIPHVCPRNHKLMIEALAQGKM